eukprot:3039209-Pyramimonas_sp.AAC.1
MGNRHAWRLELVQPELIGEATREDTRPFRGSHCRRNIESMGRDTQDTRVSLIWQGQPNIRSCMSSYRQMLGEYCQQMPNDSQEIVKTSPQNYV